MGIIHTAKKHVRDELIRKMRMEALETKKWDNINATLNVREEAQVCYFCILFSNIFFLVGQLFCVYCINYYSLYIYNSLKAYFYNFEILF